MLIFKEIYLQKCVGQLGGGIIGLNDKNEVWEIVLCFMIVELKENIPSLIWSRQHLNKTVYI